MWFAYGQINVIISEAKIIVQMVFRKSSENFQVNIRILKNVLTHKCATEGILTTQSNIYDGALQK